MTTTPTTNKDELLLSPERITEIDAQMEQEFQRDPDFLTKLENTLNAVSTTPPGTPATYVAPNNQLFAAFGQLNSLVDGWITGFPNAEKEQMRLRYFNKITARIKEKLNGKQTEYQNRKNKIEEGADKVFKSIKNLEDVIRKNWNIAPISGTTAPTITPELQNILTLANRLTKDMLLPGGTLPPTATPTTPPATTGPTLSNDNVGDIRDTLNTYLADINNNYQTFINTLAAPSGGTPPTAQDIALNNLRAAVSTLNGPSQEYFDVLEANLKNPDNGSAISYTELSKRAQILSRYSKQLTPPGVDHILSREERFSNIIVEPLAGTPGYYELFHPKRTPDPDNPYIKGDKLTEADLGNFYAWMHKNKSKLSPEQLEAVEANVQHWRGEIKTQVIDGNLSRLAGILRGGHIDTVKSEAKVSVETYFNKTINPDRKSEALNLMAMYYKLDAANMSQSKIEAAVKEKLEQELLGRLNLPNEEEQSEALDDVRETYSETQDTASRQGVLGATKARVTSEMKKEFKEKDLSNPEVRQEFTKTAVNKILQARLDTLNAVNNYKKPKWYSNLSAKLGISGSKALLGAGLLGGSALGAGIYNGSVGAGLTSAYHFVSAKVSALLGLGGGFSLAGVIKTATTGVSAVGGYLLGGQVANAFMYGPLSAAKVRSKKDVLGTKDATGASVGGLGTIDRTAGTYDNSQVQDALAAQMAFAGKHKAVLATSQDSSDLITGGSASHKAKYDTANYLWKREREGLQSIISKHLNDVMVDPTIDDADKGNRALALALDQLYGSNNIEEQFLRKVSEAKTGAQWKSRGRVLSGLAGSIGGGALFRYVL